MIKEGVLFCDTCGTKISRVVDLPAEGWPKLHAICSACFAKLKEPGT